MASVTPFPLARRTGLIRRTVRWVYCSHWPADKAMAEACKRQAAALRRAGVPEERIATEIETFKAAVMLAGAARPMHGDAG